MIYFFLLVILGAGDVAVTKDAAHACRVGAQRDALVYRVALDVVSGRLAAKRVACGVAPAGRTGASGPAAKP